MAWLGVEGHDEIVARFSHALRRGRVGGAYLFVGPAGIGKKTLAMRLAQALLCEQSAPHELDACGVCPTCQQVLAETHPDLDVVRKHPDRNVITIDLLIGDKQHRMREGLCPRIAMRPASGKRKIAIIDDADLLNLEGANCLLKTLEEPPPGSVLILIASSAQTQLPTIRSRCQMIRFQPLPADFLAQQFVERGLADSQASAHQLASRAGGSLAGLEQLASDEVEQCRRELVATLLSDHWDSPRLAKSISDFVNVEKDAPARRNRMRTVVDMAVELYRQLLRAVAGSGVEADEFLGESVSRRSISFRGHPETLIKCLERCLDARIHITANANITTCVDAWIDDLAQLSTF